ncbi:MAG TPA: helix-turn-helix domain-containing protein [Chitinophagaceae bacterium]|nr:helix-turn-helix domain-containing protein [Chitinophagaceae bacterium]
MKHISILVPEGDCSVTNIEGTWQILMRVNDFLADAGKPPIFTVKLVGLNSETSMKRGLFSVRPDALVQDVPRTDLIIIPAVHGDMKTILAVNEPMLNWIVQQYQQGAAIASLCIGAFVLAGTGLLEGRSCATHWEFAADFRKMFPGVNLVEHKILTDENGIFTSGGAYSWLNLILYLIEKYAGRDIAILCAKGFEIDIDRHSQSPFIIFRSQKDHEDEAVKKAQEYIETNADARITVGSLASMLAVGRRNLERRFKKATANTVMEYVQRVKIEAVKKSLESSRLGVNEAMDKAGYSDPKAFRAVFKKVTGLSPLQYRNRYNREFAE